MTARSPVCIGSFLLAFWVVSTATNAVDVCPALYVFDGVAERDYMGTSMSGIGDVNGDGCDDFLVGAVGYDDPDTGGTGAVYLISGDTGRVLHEWFGEDTGLGGGGGFGVYLAGAGDVDGDGVPDVITSANSFYVDGMNRAGRVYVYSGATGDLIWSWDGDRQEGFFGKGIGGAGDVNHDGFADLVMGQPGINVEETFAGRLYVYSGVTGELLWSRPGDDVSDHFGEAVAGIGDFNGDGTDDIAVGAPWHNPGKVYVVSGVDGATLWSQEYPYPNVPSGFGYMVAGAGDVNRDGCADVVVGAYLDSTLGSGSNNGSVRVFAGPLGDLLWSWEGEAVTDFFGYSVDGAGDVNGDGAADLVIGAYGHYGPAGWASGKAYVYSGATGRVLWSATGETGGDIFGEAVAGVGDVNGDGLADVGVGAKWHRRDAGVNVGRAYIFDSVPRGDCDCSGALEIEDFVAFCGCLAGANVPWRSDACACGDLDGDGDVDLHDFAVLQASYGGPA